MRKNLGYFLALLLTTAAALAQDVPTGIQKIGVLSLMRTENKVSAGPLGTVDTPRDGLGAGFQTLDFTNYTPTQFPPSTTIGPCIVANAGPLTGGTPPVTIPLDAGPFMNLNGPNGSKQFAAMKSKNIIGYGGTLGGGPAFPFPGAPPVEPLF